MKRTKHKHKGSGRPASTLEVPTTAANDVCPNPFKQYLQNGAPRTCLGERTCPIGYRCMYSKKAKAYYCCSVTPNISGKTFSKAISSECMAKMNSTFLGTRRTSYDVCPSGSALIYPKMKQPVVCTKYQKCPEGYQCLKSARGNLHICCSISISNYHGGYLAHMPKRMPVVDKAGQISPSSYR